VPSDGLVPYTNTNQSVMNMFGVPKYIVNTMATRRYYATPPKILRRGR
jgi:hypothetical protein